MNYILRVLGVLLLCIFSYMARAADYPTKPVRIIVPYAAGNGADIVMRLVAMELSKRWKETVSVDNRPGASGILAMQELKLALPDGHTIALGDVSTLVTNPSLFASLPYNPSTDFSIVTDIVTVPWVFFVKKNSNIQTLKQLEQAARAKPGGLTYGSGGNGAPNSLAIGLLRERLQIEMLEIPHKSNTDIYSAVVAGRIDLMAASLATARAYRDMLQPLAIASDDSTLSEGIPTLSNASGTNDFQIAAWSMMIVQKPVPDKVTRFLRAEIHEVFQMPLVRQKILDLGMQPGGSIDVAALDRRIKVDMVRYSQLIKAQGITKQ